MSEEKKESVANVVIDDINNLENQLKNEGDFVPEISDTKSQGGAESSGVGQVCTLMISMLCGKMAEAYGKQELALSKEEEEALKQSITEVANHYDLDAHPVVGVGLVAFGVTLPRYMMIKAITAEQNKGDTSGDQS